MEERKNIDFTVRNHININILPWQPRIRPLIGGEYKKEFTIEYKGNDYIFKRFYDDENKLVLYSYNNDLDDCVSLVIEKERKSIFISSFGKSYGCFQQETNIGSNLLKLTLKMIEKYKNYFGINKIVLTDTSTFKCSTNENIDMAMMKTLLTGDSWYGGYGFRPFDKDTYTVDEYENNKYNKNKEVMNTILLKDINLEKYLLKVYNKFPKEMTLKDVKNIIEIETKNPEKLLKDFLIEFTDKNTFDLSCKYFKTFYKELFNDIGLVKTNDFYGREI